MKNFTVKWEIDVEAKTPEEAAAFVWKDFGFAKADLGIATILTVFHDNSYITSIDFEE
jgi:hypothetical protein